MNSHATREQMEGFCARTLDLEEAAAVGGHTAWCQPCLHLFREVFQQRRNYAPVRVSLSPAHWFKDEHMDYDQLVDFVDERMDGEERELTTFHLDTCARCRGDVHSFLEYRREIEPEMQARYGPDEEQATNKSSLGWWPWRWAHWRPVQAVTALAVLVLVITAATLLWNAGKSDSQAPKTTIQTTEVSPTPSIVASVSPAIEKLVDSSATPSQSPLPNSPDAKLATVDGNVKPAETTVLLNDGGQKIRLDYTGDIIGLENLTSGLQRSVKEALLAQAISKPAPLTELNGVAGAVRSNTERKPIFRLLSPGGVVLPEARPVFSWEPLANAVAYRVLIANAANQEAAASGLLPSSATKWTPLAPLPRGGTYTWVVIATTNETEITAPAATDPEMKFSVLSAEKFKTLERLQRSTKSHLARGVFYAREGMAADAEREFRQLVKKNPNSSIALKLLRSIQSWR